MKRIFLAVAFLLLANIPTNVYCPQHGYAPCYYTGQNSRAADGALLYKFRCSCGDEVWVRGE